MKKVSLEILGIFKTFDNLARQKNSFEWDKKVKSYIKKNFHSIPKTIKKQNWCIFSRKKVIVILRLRKNYLKNLDFSQKNADVSKIKHFFEFFFFLESSYRGIYSCQISALQHFLFKSYSGGVILPHPNCLTYIKKPNWERVNIILNIIHDRS